MYSNPIRMPDVSRALARHDASTVYTLLCEGIPKGLAGRALMSLISTQTDWPIAESEEIKYDQRLTPRELDILRCAEKGMTAVETARRIPLRLETVKSHRTSIFVKFGVKNIQEAIHMGRELGLL